MPPTRRTNRSNDLSRCLAGSIGRSSPFEPRSEEWRKPLALAAFRCAMSRSRAVVAAARMEFTGGCDGLGGGADSRDRRRGSSSCRMLLGFALLDRFRVDANMRGRGMKEARKARGAHRMNIDAQERFERANLLWIARADGSVIVRPRNARVSQSEAKRTA